MSGGNQQKLLLAKMMQLNPRVIVIDEPTRGVDIGAKQQIYRFIAALAAEGRSVIVISSEMAELIGLCHRIIVMRNGRDRRRGRGRGNERARDRRAGDGRRIDGAEAAWHERRRFVTLQAAAPRRRFGIGAVAPFLALAAALRRSAGSPIRAS